MSKLIQHEVTIEVHGEKIVGHYNLERCGRWDRLTVWYHRRSLVDDEIAHEADPWSTESVAEQLLQQLATSEVKDG